MRKAVVQAALQITVAIRVVNMLNCAIQAHRPLNREAKRMEVYMERAIMEYLPPALSAKAEMQASLTVAAEVVDTSVVEEGVTP